MYAHQRMIDIRDRLFLAFVEFDGVFPGAGYLYALVLQLADRMAPAEVCDTRLHVIGQRIISRIHISEIGGAAPGRIFQVIQDRAVGRPGFETVIGVPGIARIDHADLVAVLVHIVRQDQNLRLFGEREAQVLMRFDGAEPF